MYHLTKTLLYICIVLTTFLIMWHNYGYDSKMLLLSTPMLETSQISQTSQTSQTSYNLTDLTNRMIILNNIKEEFTAPPIPISQADLLSLLQNLNIRDDELQNLNVSIASYADQVAQNTTVKEADRINTINMLSQIFGVKLNDSINKLNKVAYNEYLKSKEAQLKFKP